MKMTELRDMSDEQLGLTLKESTESLFRLKIRASTDRTDAPSERRKHRKVIARVLTVRRERELKAAK